MRTTGGVEMTKEQIQAIRERFNAATRLTEEFIPEWLDYPGYFVLIDSSNDIPALLDAMEAAEEKVEKLKEEREYWKNQAKALIRITPGR